MLKIYEMSAIEIISHIKNSRLTALEVAEAFIARIREHNPVINAIHQFDPERIRQEARKADQHQQTGKVLGKLHGLPVTIKDTCHVKGFTITKGHIGFFPGKASTYDSTVVSRLRSEGAIIFGISNVPEFLLSYETDNLVYGRTNNPYDLQRTPGGSSGGQAAIIAIGGVPAGIGSDAGGSIRQPAHYSGVCGHKPTKGLVPFTASFPSDGGLGIAMQLSTMGPMARHVEDLDLLMSIISGEDGIDPHAAPVKYNTSKNVDLSALKIAYFTTMVDAEPTSETIETVCSAVNALKTEVKSITEDFPKPAKNIYRLLWETFMLGGDKAQGIKNMIESIGTRNVSDLFKQYQSNTEKFELSITEFKQRFVEVEQFRYDMMKYMEKYDVIISPVSARPARLHGTTHDHIRENSYVHIHSLTGWPATVIPIGYSKEGLPIGIQIAAKPWRDHICLAVAKKLQQTFGVFPIPQINQASLQ